jgi:hypothetical protein
VHSKCLKPLRGVLFPAQFEDQKEFFLIRGRGKKKMGKKTGDTGYVCTVL